MLEKMVRVLTQPSIALSWIFLMGILFQPWLLWLGLIIMYSMSITPVANVLMMHLETEPALELTSGLKADAIIVLGAGPAKLSPEMPGFRPSAYTLERLRYAAFLRKQTGTPVLVTGGGESPEAETMAQSLSQDFGVDVTWKETRSSTTWENAQFSRKLLPADIRTILLVTHAWHMKRAILSFQRAGFAVIAAPTAFSTDRIHWRKLKYWIPRIRNLQICNLAIHEYMGMLWYQLFDNTKTDL